MHFPVAVPGAPVDSDICLAGPGKVQSLAVTARLNHAREQYHVCVSGKYHGETRENPDWVGLWPKGCDRTPGVFYSLYRLAAAYADIEPGQGPILSSFVTVVDYPELKNSLMELLGATDRASQ